MSKAKFNPEVVLKRPPNPYEYVGMRPGEALKRTIAIINYSAESHKDGYAMAHLAELAPCLAMISPEAIDVERDIRRGARTTDHRFTL